MKYKVIYQRGKDVPETKWSYGTPEEAADAILTLKDMYKSMHMRIEEKEHGFKVPCLNITYKILAVK